MRTRRGPLGRNDCPKMSGRKRASERRKKKKKCFIVFPRNIEYAQINIIISGTNQKVPHFPTR